jgi:hypothetical protein
MDQSNASTVTLQGTMDALVAAQAQYDSVNDSMDAAIPVPLVDDRQEVNELDVGIMDSGSIPHYMLVHILTF